MEAEARQRKRRVVMVALAACLVVAGIGGTLAWFSAQSQLTNTFKVGKITDPTTKPENPDTPIGPDDPDNPKLDGNLYEPNWVPGSKIGPGAQVAKDPYVGIGGDSEPAYVYVYVKNKFGDGNKPYFEINAHWAAVSATETATGSGKYTDGLFIYGDYTNDMSVPTALTPAPGQNAKDVWTVLPLFSHVSTSKDFTATSGADDVAGNIEVYAYVAATSNDAEKKQIADLDKAAKAWADGLKTAATN